MQIAGCYKTYMCQFVEADMGAAHYRHGGQDIMVATLSTAVKKKAPQGPPSGSSTLALSQSTETVRCHGRRQCRKQANMKVSKMAAFPLFEQDFRQIFKLILKEVWNRNH